MKNFVQRFYRLTFWNKYAFVGSVASILGLVAFLVSLTIYSDHSLLTESEINQLATRIVQSSEKLNNPKQNNELRRRADEIRRLKETLNELMAGTDPLLQNALEQLKDGNYKAAQSILKKVAEHEERKGLSANRRASIAYQHLGSVEFFTDPPRSVDAFRKSVDLDPKNKEALRSYASALQSLRKFSEAEVVYRKLLELSRRNKDDKNLTHAYLGLSEIYLSLGRLDKAEEYIDIAFRITLRNDDKYDQASALALRGLINAFKDDTKEANLDFCAAIIISEESNNMNAYVCASDNIAMLRVREGKFDEAVRKFKETVEIYKKHDFKSGLADQYSNLTTLYRRMKLWNEAENYAKKSLNVYREIGHKKRIAEQYQTLGFIYRMQKKHKLMCANWQFARRGFNQLDMRENRAEVVGWMAWSGCL